MTEEKTEPHQGPGFSNCRRGGRQYLPEGNMLHAGDSGRIYRRNSEPQVCEACGSATTPIVACQPCAIANRWESPFFRNQSDDFDCRMATNQKCQRCAFATRKSRNTWMRATDLSSSGYTK